MAFRDEQENFEAALNLVTRQCELAILETENEQRRVLVGELWMVLCAATNLYFTRLRGVV